MFPQQNSSAMSAAAISESEGEEDMGGEDGEQAPGLDTHMSNYRLPSPCNTMQVQLQDARSANMIVVKLITQENRMLEWNDEHGCANIDMNHVQCIGKLVNMPRGVRLSSG
ncbi:hypothetical protein WJX84_001817 [Apatococcus fuscideae]|uniref:Uncharacterized protein n=1 Tax=Apatococcus fuscideae TaxID=2026836 RepID=A0AAW1S789_9CHLO